MTDKIILKADEEEVQMQQPRQVEAPKQQSEETKPEIKLFDKKEEMPPTVTLNMRRGFDGRLMIYEHDHIDIVYIPDKKKILAFAKRDYSDIIYETQDRLLSFLAKKGICSPESIRGGNVYGSLEAQVLEAPQQDFPTESLLVMNIKKWIDSEQPSLEMNRKYKEEFVDMLTDPDPEDSTELGEVPQDEKKGSIPKHASRRFVGGWW